MTTPRPAVSPQLRAFLLVRPAGRERGHMCFSGAPPAYGYGQFASVTSVVPYPQCSAPTTLPLANLYHRSTVDTALLISQQYTESDRPRQFCSLSKYLLLQEVS